MQNNDLDLLNNDSIKKENKTGNIFEFKPGHRWGTAHSKASIDMHGEDEGEMLKEEQRESGAAGKNALVLRGPHQEKKTKHLVDEKKKKLAKSIFGKTKKI